MKIEKISINGQIQPLESARLNANDQGLMYGLGAFETFRVIGGKVFLLEKHFDRLEKNLKALNITVAADRAKNCSWIKDLTTGLDDNFDAFIRFMVTGGDGHLGLSKAEFAHPRTIIYLSLIKPLMPTPKRAATLKTIFRSKPEYFVKTGFRIKAPDYISARIAQAELAEWDAKTNPDKAKTTPLDGVMLTSDGYVAEALTSNIFWVKNGELFTPPLNTGILTGTIRTYLLETNTVQEKLAAQKELHEADEIFLTSGVSYINPLEEIDGIKKSGVNGPIFQKLFDRLRQDMADLSETL